MSSKHDNCQNNKTNVFGGSRGKERDCEVCSEVKHERFQTGCDTVSFSSAQIKSPFSPLNPPQHSPPNRGPPKSSSPLNGLFFERLSRSKARKVRDDSWSTRVKCVVAVTESYKRTACGVFTVPFSQSCGVSRWCPSPVDLWSGALVCQTTIGDYRQWQRFILTPCPNQTREVFQAPK